MTKQILKLLKEPSTYAGFAGILASIGVWGMTEDQWMQVGSALAAVAGAAAMVISEATKD
jgi:hypothetical protein